MVAPDISARPMLHRRVLAFVTARNLLPSLGAGSAGATATLPGPWGDAASVGREKARREPKHDHDDDRYEYPASICHRIPPGCRGSVQPMTFGVIRCVPTAAAADVGGGLSECQACYTRSRERGDRAPVLVIEITVRLSEGDDRVERGHQTQMAPFRLGLVIWLAAAVVGCGGGNDDAVDEARQARVSGIEYSVLRARPLNPQDQPDDAYYNGSPPPAGRILLAAYVTACNVSDAARRSTDDLFLVDSPFETRYEPVDLEDDNPFAYEPTRLEPGECRPSPNSAAEQGPGASLAIFEVPVDALQNRPLYLVLDEPAGDARLEGAKRIRLDF